MPYTVLQAFDNHQEGEQLDESAFPDAVAQALVDAGVIGVADAEVVEEEPVEEARPQPKVQPKVVQPKSIPQDYLDSLAWEISNRVKKDLAPIKQKSVTLPAVARNKHAEYEDYFRTALYAKKGIPSAISKLASNFGVRSKVTTGQTIAAGTPTQGAYTIPEEWRAGVFEKMQQKFNMMNFFNVDKIGGSILHIPIEADTSLVDGGRNLRYYKVAELGAYTPSAVVFGEVIIQPVKFGVVASYTEEMAEDSAFSISGYLERKITNELTWCINDQSVNGAGGAGDPEGLLNATALVTVSAQAAPSGTLQLPSIVQMFTQMHPEGKARGIWLAGYDTYAALLLLAFDPAATGGKTSAYGLTWSVGESSTGKYTQLYLFGRPVHETLVQPSLGMAGDLIFFDPEAFAFGWKGDIETGTNEYLEWLNGNVLVRGHIRFDQGCLWNAALTPHSGNTAKKISCVLTTASRGST